MVAGKAWTSAYSFHAMLFAIGSAFAIFTIVDRYMDRPAELPPREIDGKPNYNYGPIKFATVAGVFWGVAGFSIGLWIALELAFPRLQPRPAMGQFRPPAPAAHLRGDLRLRRQRAHRHKPLCRAAHLPRPPHRRPRSLVRRARLQLLHPHRRHRLSARHHPVEGICRTGVVCRPVADRRLGHLPAHLHGHAAAPEGAAHLCGQLVLPRLHHDHRSAASRQ